MCWKKRERISKEDTWWLNEEVKEAVSRKIDTDETMCWNSTEENKRRYNSIKNKAVSKTMREKAEEAHTE